jgi:hypothetical protein
MTDASLDLMDRRTRLVSPSGEAWVRAAGVLRHAIER